MANDTKRRGRPAKEPTEGERIPFSLRITADLKRDLEGAIAVSGRSLSQEAEYRLNRSFSDDSLFPSPDMRFWAVYMAGKFHSIGSKAAADKGHPEWTDREWMADPECFQEAAFQVMNSLLIETLKQPHADIEAIGLRLQSLQARGATYLHNTGKLPFPTGGNSAR
jgi:hypothetical protein